MTDEPKTPEPDDPALDQQDDRVSALEQHVSSIDDKIALILAKLSAPSEPVEERPAPPDLSLPKGVYARYRHANSDHTEILRSAHSEYVLGRVVPGMHREMEFRGGIFDLNDRIIRKWKLDLELKPDGSPYTDEQNVERAKHMIESLENFNVTIFEDPLALHSFGPKVSDGPSSSGTRTQNTPRPEAMRTTVVTR